MSYGEVEETENMTDYLKNIMLQHDEKENPMGKMKERVEELEAINGNMKAKVKLCLHDTLSS